MERRSLRCNVSQLAVKFTAVFALATLFHTLLVLNGKSLHFSNYLKLKAQPSSGQSRDYGKEIKDYNTVYESEDERRISSKDHLRFTDEEEKEESAIDHEDDINGQDNNLEHSVIDGETFSPKRTYTTLGEHEISSVKNFVFFVGYSRSGHSIVASLLDAHPNIIIAHEYNLFRMWKSGNRYQNRSFLYNELYRNSYRNAEKGWRSSAKDQKGYTLAVKDSWQGSFQKLLVIGEKSGAVTAQTYDNDPLMFLQILKELKDTVQVPIRVIHVVRNPYDILSTRLLYMDGKSKKFKVQASVDKKHVSHYSLSQQVNRTIHIVQNVQELLFNGNFTTFEIHLADLVLNPDHVLNNLCMFIGVECSQDYLQKCSHKLYNTPSETRLLVDWPQSLVDKVYEMIIKPYQPFWRYSFTSS